MFGGWSQLNENLQGDFSIIQQISALRREKPLPQSRADFLPCHRNTALHYWLST